MSVCSKSLFYKLIAKLAKWAFLVKTFASGAFGTTWYGKLGARELRAPKLVKPLVAYWRN